MAGSTHGAGGGTPRTRKRPAGPAVMTNRAALRVLYDLAGKKTWYTLGNELGFRVEDINKKNYPWPSDFGCHEYCAKFQEYAKAEHTSPYAALIKVRDSLIESNAYTPEVERLVDNVLRPDSDEAAYEAALRRLMETIIETALPYNKVPRAVPAAVPEECAGQASEAPGEQAGGAGPYAQVTAVGTAGAAAQVGGLAQPGPQASATPDAGPQLASNAPSCVWPGPGAFLLDGRGGQAALRAILPADVLLAAVACVPGDARACEALVGRLCSDSGLALRAMQRACAALAANPGVDAGMLFAQLEAAFSAAGTGSADGRSLARARGVYLRYCDGDAGRGLLCCALLHLLGPQGFVRVMTCPATRELFER